MCDNYFIRNFDINVLNITLKLEQKFEGDVGCVVWDASIVLAKYLEVLYKKDPLYFRNIWILELGAGVGCVGITAACLGANVVLTDLPKITPLLERNIRLNIDHFEKNNGSVKVLSLPWGSRNVNEKPDVILLADCIYYKESIDSLIETLIGFCGRKTRVLLSQEIRESEKQQECWRYFLKTVNNYFKSYFIPLEEHDEEFRSSDIVIMSLSPS